MEHALAMIEMKAISGAYDRQHEKDEAKRKKKIRRKEIEKSRGESVLPTKRHRKPTNFYHSMFDSQSKKGNDSAIKKKKKPPKKRPEPDNSQDVCKRVEKYTDPIPRKKRRIIEESDSGDDGFISDQDDVKRSDEGSVLAKCIPFATDSSLLYEEDIEESIKSGRANLSLLREKRRAETALTRINNTLDQSNNDHRVVQYNIDNSTTYNVGPFSCPGTQQSYTGGSSIRMGAGPMFSNETISSTSRNLALSCASNADQYSRSIRNSLSSMNVPTRRIQNDVSLRDSSQFSFPASAPSFNAPAAITNSAVATSSSSNILSLVTNFEARCGGEYDRKWICRFKEAYYLLSRNIVPRSGYGPHSSIARWINLQRKRNDLCPLKKELFAYLESL